MKICDHPSLCLSVANTTAAAAAASASSSTLSPSTGERVGKGNGAEDGEEEEEKEEDNEGKQAAVAAAVAAAGLTESDLDGDPEASGKAAFLMSLLRHLADNGHRTLVFSQSRAMLDILERAARADGHNLIRIDGNVPADERHARVERFQTEPDIPLAGAYTRPLLSST
jgi:SNF2 family DNA or RNA helicase